MQKVVFLDRDGTLNIDPGTPVFLPEHWEWHDKVFEALRLLQDAGYVLAVVTNQTGIGHKLYTEEQMAELHRFMLKELEEKGLDIAVVAYCPHHREENCDCRKPNIGMAKQVEKKIGTIDYASSWMIGDKVADFEFGRNIGAKTTLIRSQYWTEDTLTAQPDLIVDSLFEAAQHITNDHA
ncbi:MAG: HAD family hydrolase [Candidatus Andersenbacteria bacterium]|nr:HAD family hydrolase [Candidatus Andersenbacteria bacterium]MBI3251093.1 HAD family hydrolase [Candidatus Andersenbacteria bacterium]